MGAAGVVTLLLALAACDSRHAASGFATLPAAPTAVPAPTVAATLEGSQSSSADLTITDWNPEPAADQLTASEWCQQSCDGTWAAHGNADSCHRVGMMKDSIQLNSNVGRPTTVQAASPELPLTGYRGKWLPFMSLGGSSVSIDCDLGWKIGRNGRRQVRRGFHSTPAFGVTLSIPGNDLVIPDDLLLPVGTNLGELKVQFNGHALLDGCLLDVKTGSFRAVDLDRLAVHGYGKRSLAEVGGLLGDCLGHRYLLVLYGCEVHRIAKA